MSAKLENLLIAKRYAKALLGLAGADAASLAEPAGKLAEVARQSDVAEFLSSPLYSRAQSAVILGGLFDKIGAPALLKNLALRMAQNRRLPVLAEALDQFVLLVEEKQGIMRVKITSAVALSDADVEVLAKKIASKYGTKVSVVTRVDPSLIGGVRLQMGDKQIDYSVAGKLERLREHLKETSLAPAASGASS